MEQNTNIPRASDLLTPELIEQGEQPPADLPAIATTPAGASRADGWTPDRIRIFLHALSQCGVVADAARAAGMSKAGAYAFRNSARGRAFDVAWNAALLLARRRLADEVMSRAVNGCVEVIVRDGEVWGERHRFDNRLTMAVLARLDQVAQAPFLTSAPSRVAHEFDAFVDAVCAGGDAAGDFIETRRSLRTSWFDEEHVIARNDAYVEGGLEAVSWKHEEEKDDE